MNQGLTQMRDSVVTSVSGKTVTRTITETWIGEYARLKSKQESSWKTSISTNLQPGDGGNGTLTIVREEKIELQEEAELPEPTTEVIWQELRIPVTQHPAFKDLDAETVKKIRKDAESEDGTAPTNEVELKLYNLLAKGVTEYATGVPVVRRNSTKRSGDAGGGNAWVRGNPPVDVSGSWEWMKTADERREDGDTFTLVEEWTGATQWDDTLYPTS